jgi:hypothetical protein
MLLLPGGIVGLFRNLTRRARAAAPKGAASARSSQRSA